MKENENMPKEGIYREFFSTVPLIQVEGHCTLCLQALFLVRFDPNFAKRKGNMLQKVNQMDKRMNKQTDHYRVLAEWDHNISQKKF